VPGVTSVQFLASGGNSTVYRAWQPALDRWVAVKVLGLTLSDGRARDRFRRECGAVGRLTGHPNIVTVLDSGVTTHDRPYLTMDLFERGSLADLIATSGPAPAELALRYGVKLAGALETAHRAAILHRDLKPENVLLSRFGEPGLADFGIATLGEVRGGTEAFTPTHAAPEVLEGRQATAAADVYGLGSTLWTALAGRLPFGDGAEGPLKLMLRVLQEPVPALEGADVPPVVEEALRWAMAKEPADRPPTALAFGQRLRALQAEIGVPVSELVVPDDLGSLDAPVTSEPGPLATEGRFGAGRRPRGAGPGGRPTTVAPATIRPGWVSGPGGAPAPDSTARAPGDAASWAPPVPGSPEPGRGRVPPGSPPAPAVPPGTAERREPSRELSLPSGFGRPPAEPVAGQPKAPDLAATFVRSRAPQRGPEAIQPEVSRPTAMLELAIVAGALLLAVALVLGALIATRKGGGSRAAPTTAPVVVGTNSTGAGGSTTTAPPARSPTGVAVRLADPTTALVTWSSPADRSGLVGFVVAHRPRDGTGDLTTQGVSGSAAVQAAVVLSTPEARCFVVQSIYLTGTGAASDPACT